MAPRFVSYPRTWLGRVALSAVLLATPLTPAIGADAPPPEPAPPGSNGDAWLGGILLVSGALITGLSALLLVTAYEQGDPADNPDPDLTEDEQWDAELHYDRSVAYGWGFGIVSVGMTVLGGFLLASALDDDRPGIATGVDGVRWAPMVGPTVGAGLFVEF